MPKFDGKAGLKWCPLLSKARFLGLLFPLFILSCVSRQVPLEERLAVSVSSSHPKIAHTEVSGMGTPQLEEGEAKAGFRSVRPLRYQGILRYRSVGSNARFSKKKMVHVVVDQMALPDFVHYIFSDIFAVNYVVDSRVKEKRQPVTLNLRNRISEYQLFGVVKNVLQQHGVTIFLKDGIYYIWQQRGHEQIALGIGNSIRDIPATTGRVQQVVPVKYTDVQGISKLLPRPPKMMIVPDPNNNILVVTGARDQVVQVLRFIKMLDRPVMRGRYIGMIRLTYWSPKDMVKKLADILTEEGIPVTNRVGRKGVYMTTLERRGTIIFFAAEKEWFERVKYWARTLDVPSGRKKRYFLYVPQNSKASELGESLQKILGLSGSGGEISGQQKRSIEGRRQVWGQKKVKEPERQKAVEQIGAMGGEDVSMAVDESRNALIFYTTPEKFKALRTLLVQLDVMPVQVLLDASVAEVTLTGSLQYGLEWFLKNGSGSQTSILKTLGGLSLGNGGMNYSLISDSQKFQLLINALAKKDMVKVLSSPRITVRDGKNASIVVGTEVPVITSEGTTPEIQSEGNSGIIRSVQYRSTGVSLQVTPSVHAKGVVTLEITQEVSEAQTNNTSNISSPIILNRSLSTEVVAADGQTVLLGGLIKENNSNTVTKVPLLGDIPILGYLFKTTSKGSNRTELVVMITPHIIRSTRQIDEMRDAIFRGFEHVGIEGVNGDD